MTGRPTNERLYLDHAATGWPKSDRVLDAMRLFQQDCGAAFGRGGYASARRAGEIVSDLRRGLAKAIHAPDPNTVSFHASGTAAIQAAIFGVVRPGDHVVTTVAEHNSVLRPLHHLSRVADVRITVVPVSATGRVDADAVCAEIDDDTSLVAVTGASNVSGLMSPLTAIGKALRDHSCRFLVDAAQNFGWHSIDVQASRIDLLAAPGHKAAGGPLGTAMLYAATETHPSLHPSLFGGTGSQSESLEMPTEYPDKMEAGNLNVPALAGWLAEVAYWDDSWWRRRSQRAAELSNGLFEAVTRSGFQTAYPKPEIPLVSFWHDEIDAQTIAAILDSEFAIEVRAGLHCAAKIHEASGHPSEGVVRVSAGPDTTAEDLARLEAALREIAGS